MADRGVALRCDQCGMTWDVLPKPDGTMPGGSRCPKNRGGCGKLRKLPVSARAGGALPAAGWEPTGGPRAAREVAEQCPECAGPLFASPRGTTRVCLSCSRRVTPAATLAPYERGESTGRQVKTQRETDLEALDLAGRKGVMLGQLRGLADGDRLDDGSRLKVEWFADEVRAARTAARLDDLAGLWAAARIRPRRWWQPQTAALDAADGYEDDEYVDEDDDRQDDEPAAVVLATPASIAAQQLAAHPQRMTWAEALAACGWRIAPAIGSCQVIDEHGRHCEAGIAGTPPIIDALGRSAWLCQWHYGTLGGLIIKTNHARGVA